MFASQHPHWTQPDDWRGQIPPAERYPAEETRMWPDDIADNHRAWPPGRHPHAVHSVQITPVRWYDDRFSRFTWTMIRVSGLFAALAIIAVGLRIIWAVWPR